MKHLKSKSVKNYKLLLTGLFLLAASISMQAQIAIGGGLAYNEKISGPGITVKGVLHITDAIAIAPGVTYFFGSSLYGYNQNTLAVDLNAHYNFDLVESKLQVYPLIGANYSNYKTGVSYYSFYYDTYEVSDSAFGVNIGAGGRWKFSEKLSVYLEPKYVVSDYEQIIINAGVLLQL
ncbi:outer membrane beta-barrel protein [Bizionia sp. KMM 8389]